MTSVTDQKNPFPKFCPGCGQQNILLSGLSIMGGYPSWLCLNPDCNHTWYELVEPTPTMWEQASKVHEARGIK